MCCFDLKWKFLTFWGIKRFRNRLRFLVAKFRDGDLWKEIALISCCCWWNWLNGDCDILKEEGCDIFDDDCPRDNWYWFLDVRSVRSRSVLKWEDELWCKLGDDCVVWMREDECPCVLPCVYVLPCVWLWPARPCVWLWPIMVCMAHHGMYGPVYGYGQWGGAYRRPSPINL